MAVNNTSHPFQFSVTLVNYVVFVRVMSFNTARSIFYRKDIKLKENLISIKTDLFFILWQQFILDDNETNMSTRTVKDSVNINIILHIIVSPALGPIVWCVDTLFGQWNGQAYIPGFSRRRPGTEGDLQDTWGQTVHCTGHRKQVLWS